MKEIKIIIVVLLAVMSSCQQQKEKPVAAPAAAPAVETDMVNLSAAQVQNAGVIVGLPEKKSMSSTLKVNGVIDVPPQNIISVSVPMGGYLKRTSLIEGTKVSKGTVLATMEDQQYIQLQQDYLTTKSRLGFLEVDYNRQKGLNETKSASDKVVQQAKSEFETNRILLRSLGEKLKMIGINPEKINEDNITGSISIFSPINGYVTKVNVNTGKYVNPSDVLFELINPDDLHVRLTVFENDAAKIVMGQKILFTVNSAPTEKYAATVHLITPNIGAERSTDVHCHLENHAKDIFPGTFVNAEVLIKENNVEAVPEAAVVKWENKNYVFTEVAENSFRLTPVETGISNDGFVELKTPTNGNRIVLKNAYTILMKMKNSSEE